MHKFRFFSTNYWKNSNIKVNNKIPANCSQIVKKYLEDQEINEGFQYTYKGKNEAKANRVRRKKKRLISWVSFSCWAIFWYS